MTHEAEVLATLGEYAAAYCAKDTDRLMALFAPGDGKQDGTAYPSR